MAPPILSYEGLGLIQGEGWLFRGLDVYVGERDRLALIGRNGARKTTFFKCLADQIETHRGKQTNVPCPNVRLLEEDPPMAGLLKVPVGGRPRPPRPPDISRCRRPVLSH